jgi:hypothetical protein
MLGEAAEVRVLVHPPIKSIGYRENELYLAVLGIP